MTAFPIALAAVACVALFIVIRGPQRIAEDLLGIGLTLRGVLLATGVRQWLQTRKVALGEDAGRLLGTKTRETLTRSLAIEVDQLMARCRTADERFLASIAIMIDEYVQGIGLRRSAARTRSLRRVSRETDESALTIVSTV